MIEHVRRAGSAHGFSLIELLMVVAIMGVLAAIAIPMSGNAVRYLKISGDARSLSNNIAAAKMRAAAKFTQARLFVDLDRSDLLSPDLQHARHVAVPGVDDGGRHYSLSSTVSFGYGGATYGAPEHAIDHRPVARVPRQLVAAGGDCQFRVHHLQFARCPGRYDRHADRDRRRLRHRWIGDLRRDDRGDGFVADLAGHELGIADLGAAMIARRWTNDTGSTLIEVLIASGIMVTLMAGLMSMASMTLTATENQGHLAARTAEYAQDKMEQLLALAYGDAISDTTTFPATEQRAAPA